nr:ABC transporter substrate binding protein [Bradyrhizobium sp. Ghvi]
MFPSPMLYTERRRIVDLATEHRLPIMTMGKEFVQLGELTSYEATSMISTGAALAYVDNILKGAKPADLCVEQPTKFVLFINLETAKVLGLEIPASLLAR